MRRKRTPQRTLTPTDAEPNRNPNSRRKLLPWRTLTPMEVEEKLTDSENDEEVKEEVESCNDEEYEVNGSDSSSSSNSASEGDVLYELYVLCLN